MKIRAATICGALLIFIGIASLIRPQFSYRVESHSQQVGGSKVMYETRRVVRFPLWFSIPMMAIGAAFVFIGFYQE